MIRITIENPSDHDYDELQAVIHYLQKVADLGKTSTAPILRAAPEAPSPTMPVDMVAQQAAAAELDKMLASTQPAKIAHTNVSEPAFERDFPAPKVPTGAELDKVLATGVEVDVNGLPWDARIHAGNRAKIADGSWRRRRGVDAELVTTVEAELRALMAAPGAEQLGEPVRAMTAKEASEYVSFPPAAPAPAPAAPEAPPAPPAPPAPTGPAPLDVFKRLTELRDGLGFSDEQLSAALSAVGFKAVNDVFKRPDLAGAFLDVINGLAGAE